MVRLILLVGLIQIGEYVLRHLTEFNSLWDSFRSQFPFLTVVDTLSIIDMIKGLLNIYKADGWLPDCHMSLCKGFTQGGSNADNIISDAYQKIGGSEIDWNLAYEAVVKDAEEEPYGQSSTESSNHADVIQIGVARVEAVWTHGSDSVTFPRRTSITSMFH